MEEYDPGDEMMHLPCEHAFHAKCIKGWLSQYSSECACGHARAPMLALGIGRVQP